MSSDSESDIYNEESASNELSFVAEEVSKFPQILQKSQVPGVKREKDEAIRKVVCKYKTMFGKDLDAKGLLKKINNMKGRLKKKTDLKTTGNKIIKLLEWEKKMLKAMEADTNPTVIRIQGALQIGNTENTRTLNVLNKSSSLAAELCSEDSHSSSKMNAISTHVSTSTAPSKLPPQRKSSIDNHETEETRSLTTKDLQRLVFCNSSRLLVYKWSTILKNCKCSTPLKSWYMMVKKHIIACKK